MTGRNDSHQRLPDLPRAKDPAMPGRPFLPVLLLASCLATEVRADVPFAEVVADPVTVQLRSPAAGYSLLVHGKTTDGRLVDLTRGAQFRSSRPEIAAINARGVIRAVADGKA